MLYATTFAVPTPNSCRVMRNSQGKVPLASLYGGSAASVPGIYRGEYPRPSTARIGLDGWPAIWLTEIDKHRGSSARCKICFCLALQTCYEVPLYGRKAPRPFHPHGSGHDQS